VRVAVVGQGAVGRRCAQALARSGGFEQVLVRDEQARSRSLRLPQSLSRRQGLFGLPPAAEVVVLAIPKGAARLAARAVSFGQHVVAAVDDPAEVRALLALDSAARRSGSHLVVGATMAPGLSCLLAAYLARQVDRVDELHVASLGTGGPACARRHHSALAGVAVDWVDGEWRRRPGGSGRELVWFPDPVGGADCYRAALPDALLLARAFPEARRITSRLAATRRDRLTSALPMLRPPHPEGLVGAVRVEVRGRKGVRAETVIAGSATPPAPSAAAVSALAALWAATGRLARSGAGGLAELVASPAEMLAELAKEGVSVYAFEGADIQEPLLAAERQPVGPRAGSGSAKPL